MRSFLLLLLVDIAVVAGGLALFRPAPGPVPAEEDPSTAAETRQLREEVRRLKSQADWLEAQASAGASVPTPAAPGVASAPPARQVPQVPTEDLDRLEAALQAVKQRRAVKMAEQTLRTAVAHVFPDLTPEQLDGAAAAVVAYRTLLTKALMPGGAGAQEGYETASADLRWRLSRVVSAKQADDIVRHYAVRPGPPTEAPAVSPPITPPSPQR